MQILNTLREQWENQLRAIIKLKQTWPHLKWINFMILIVWGSEEVIINLLSLGLKRLGLVLIALKNERAKFYLSIISIIYLSSIYPLFCDN